MGISTEVGADDQSKTMVRVQGVTSFTVGMALTFLAVEIPRNTEIRKEMMFVSKIKNKNCNK